MCIDDLRQDVVSFRDLSKLFTRESIHLGCSALFLAQNIFPKRSETRTISLNAQYWVLLKNLHDALQVSVLAHQLLTSHLKHFIDAN